MPAQLPRCFASHCSFDDASGDLSAKGKCAGKCANMEATLLVALQVRHLKMQKVVCWSVSPSKNEDNQINIEE